MNPITDKFQRLQNHKYFKEIAGAVVLILFYFSFKIYLWANTQSTDNAYLQADITFLSVEIDGTINSVMLYDNAIVSKGDVIATIDDRDCQANYKKACSAYDAKGKALEALNIQIEIKQTNLDKAKSNTWFQQANAKFNSLNLKRSQTLNKDKFTSQQLVDKSENEYNQAKNSLTQAELDLRLAEQNLNLLKIQLKQQQFELETLVQEKALAEKQLIETKIRSPIDGVIASHNVRVGSFVSPGMLLCAIVPNKSWYVKANFKETQIYKFKPGMRAELKFDGVPGKKFKGKIRGIYPATGSNFSLIPPDNSTGNFTKIVQRVPVLIDFEPPENTKIVPGMSTIVSIKTNQ